MTELRGRDRFANSSGLDCWMRGWVREKEEWGRHPRFFLGLLDGSGIIMESENPGESEKFRRKALYSVLSSCEVLLKSGKMGSLSSVAVSPGYS